MIDDRVSGSHDGDWHSRSSRFPGRWSVILDLNDSRPSIWSSRTLTKLPSSS